MRCGCISMGDIKCGACHRTIPYLECYLVMENEAEDVLERFCLDCASGKGFIQYKEEKGEQVITFFAGNNIDLLE